MPLRIELLLLPSLLVAGFLIRSEAASCSEFTWKLPSSVLVLNLVPYIQAIFKLKHRRVPDPKR